MAAKDLLKELKDAHETFAAARREIIGLAAKAQNASKRAIFAVQREDDAGAKALLAEAEDAIEAIRERAKKNARLAHEGSYRAALESTPKPVRRPARLEGRGGRHRGPRRGDADRRLCDAAGEVVRLMVRAATEGRDKETRELKARLDRLMEGLDAMDYSGYLRTKYDQAVPLPQGRGHPLRLSLKR